MTNLFTEVCYRRPRLQVGRQKPLHAFGNFSVPPLDVSTNKDTKKHHNHVTGKERNIMDDRGQEKKAKQD